MRAATAPRARRAAVAAVRGAVGGIAAVALLTAASVRPASAITVRQYLDLTPPDAGGGPLEQRRYLTGFRDSLYDFNLVLGSLGVQVFCIPGGLPPLDLPEFRRRLDAEIAAKRASRQDFDAYARDTELGVVGLEVLAADYPCGDEAGGGGQRRR